MTDKTVKEFRDLWVAALRSGEYSQTTGTLADEDGYCCLGVAGAVLGYTEDDLCSEKYNSHSNLVYDQVKEAFGLTHEGSSALVDYNDSDKWNFNQIADLIETAPEKLFIRDE